MPIFLALSFFCSKKSHGRKGLWLFAVIIAIFAVLHIFGLFFNFCFSFDGHVVEFRRYASPMYKLLLLTTFAFVVLAIQSIKNKKLACLFSLGALLLALGISWITDCVAHIRKLPNSTFGVCAAASLPGDDSLFGKSALFISSSIHQKRDWDYMGSTMLSYPFALPNKMNFVVWDSHKTAALAKTHDYIFWYKDFALDFGTLTNKISPQFLALLDDPKCLERSCLLYMDKRNNKVSFKLAFQDSHVVSNLLESTNFIPDSKITVNLQKDHFYQVAMTTDENSSASPCATFGDNPIYSKNNFASLLMRAKHDGPCTLRFLPNSFKKSRFHDVEILDLGQIDRNWPKK